MPSRSKKGSGSKGTRKSIAALPSSSPRKVISGQPDHAVVGRDGAVDDFVIDGPQTSYTAPHSADGFLSSFKKSCLRRFTSAEPSRPSGQQDHVHFNVGTAGTDDDDDDDGHEHRSLSTDNGNNTLRSRFGVPANRKQLLSTLRRVPSRAQLDRLERSHIVLWKKPLLSLQYFILGLAYLFMDYSKRLWVYRRRLFVCLCFTIVISILSSIPGPHDKVLNYMEKKLVWCLYWCGLGILSSVGLGTGLHTFLLYLGPHIASVTLAAFECESLKFPEPPYPDEIICPVLEDHSVMSSNGSMAMGNISGASATDSLAASASGAAAVSLWAIITKVRLEAFMWGTGTALGELPPYFMAQAARLSGEEPDDEEFREFEHLLTGEGAGDQAVQTSRYQSFGVKVKLFMERLVEQGGFSGILLCASIPNPLFDLAGITCGYFGVPFWTFFGATLIGKAVIKMHIQKLFVIFTFSEKHAEKIVNSFKYVPKYGRALQEPFKDYLKQQKIKLHRKPGEHIPVKTTWIQKVFEIVVLTMILYFLVSIINSVAQGYHKRLCAQRDAARGSGSLAGTSQGQIPKQVAYTRKSY